MQTFLAVELVIDAAVQGIAFHAQGIVFIVAESSGIDIGVLGIVTPTGPGAQLFIPPSCPQCEIGFGEPVGFIQECRTILGVGGRADAIEAIMPCLCSKEGFPFALLCCGADAAAVTGANQTAVQKNAVHISALGGFSGDDIDYPAQCAVAIQGAVSALYYFDAFNISQRKLRQID